MTTWVLFIFLTAHSWEAQGSYPTLGDCNDAYEAYVQENLNKSYGAECTPVTKFVTMVIKP